MDICVSPGPGSGRVSHHPAASETPGILLEAQASAAGSQTAWTWGSQVSQHSRPVSSARRKPQASRAMPASGSRQPRLDMLVFHPAHLSRRREQPTGAQVPRITTAGCQVDTQGQSPSAWGQEGRPSALPSTDAPALGTEGLAGSIQGGREGRTPCPELQSEQTEEKDAR